MLINRRISFLSSLQSKYDHYLPCVLNLFSYVHINQHSFKSSNFGDANTPQRALITRFTCKNRPESKHLFLQHLLNNLSHRTIARTERGDRLLQMANDSWHNGVSNLWEREVWMNVKSPLGRAKWIFWAEMLDNMLQSWCALRVTSWVAQISRALKKLQSVVFLVEILKK